MKKNKGKKNLNDSVIGLYCGTVIFDSKEQ